MERFATDKNIIILLAVAALGSNIFIHLCVTFCILLPFGQCLCHRQTINCLHDLLEQESACRVGFLYSIC